MDSVDCKLAMALLEDRPDVDHALSMSVPVRRGFPDGRSCDWGKESRVNDVGERRARVFRAEKATPASAVALTAWPS